MANLVGITVVTTSFVYLVPFVKGISSQPFGFHCLGDLGGKYRRVEIVSKVALVLHQSLDTAVLHLQPYFLCHLDKGHAGKVVLTQLSQVGSLFFVDDRRTAHNVVSVWCVLHNQILSRKTGPHFMSNPISVLL